MTFILSVVCVDPSLQPRVQGEHFIIEEAVQDEHSWARAGFLPGLSRYFDKPIQGEVYYVLQNEGDNYRASNRFFTYPETEDAPAKLTLSGRCRVEFDSLVRKLAELSAVGRVLIVAEYNGSVTAPELDEESTENVDVVGPLSISQFWLRHDLGEILEESVVVIEEAH